MGHCERSKKNDHEARWEYIARKHSFIQVKRRHLFWTYVSLLLMILFIVSVDAKEEKDVEELQIGVKYKPNVCELQAHKGDRVKVHYRGSLTSGSVFDASYDRGEPFEFLLGSGQVIKGWDQGLLGMCVGEKRKLKIPSKLGYGAQGSPPKIPGGATLIFDTELVAVNGKTKGTEVKSDL
ncbi:hypothetical protein O6H91_11G087100 [Diphasiastrum complanatum]|nr:hypothetical protein O6H91_Y515100 [Diphasiastrum complanatum]KAJ7539319.1 hypothetical protein O6H91_11G087100 [Diphasiastrum complanatum]